MNSITELKVGGLQSLPFHTNLRLKPPVVSPSDSISVVVDTMIREDLGAVIVVEEGRPIGIITEKDVLVRVVQPQKDFDMTLAESVMSKPLVSIEADRTIKEALGLMRRYKIRRLVVTRDGVILGLTTERRLLEIAYGHSLMNRHNSEKVALYNTKNRIKVAYLSSYPPKKCGIATYTKDVVDAVNRLYILEQPSIVAVNDKGAHYNYGREVEFQIDRERVDSYLEASEYINKSNVDIVNIQHEFGIFGGSWGKHVLEFLENIEKPVVTTLHTLLLEPEPEGRRVLEGILRYSSYVIVMARVGIQILEQIYETLGEKVRYIPHGCPNLPFIKSETIKSRIGLDDKIVLSTFGLLSRGKGIEFAIQALPTIVKMDPRILYLIIGETHPEVRKNEGELYRKELISLVETLGLEDNVRFVDSFLPLNELIRYLQATDIYLLPYPNKEQISSGTLLYALSTGRAIVSTPFLHAEEVISEGCASKCEFRNPSSITDKIKTLLLHEDTRRRLEENAYKYSRGMIWPNVAMKYVNVFYEALEM